MAGVRSDNFVIKGSNYVEVRVNSEIYSLSAIYAAAYIFLDQAYIYFDKDNQKDRVIVFFFPRNKRGNIEELGFAFLNELLNYAHYSQSLKSNKEIVKLLLQRGLISAAPSLLQEAEEKEIDELMKELEEEEESGK